MRAPGGLLADRPDDQRMGMPHCHDAKAVVKVDVFIAIDVPDAAALPVVDEHRLGGRGLEGGGNAPRGDGLGDSSHGFPPRGFFTASAEMASSMRRLAFCAVISE